MTADTVVENSHYRYRLSSTGDSSVKYGLCEVCKKHCSEVFHQVEERYFCSYIDGERLSGYTRADCHGLFGHKACLESKRKLTLADCQIIFPDKKSFEDLFDLHDRKGEFYGGISSFCSINGKDGRYAGSVYVKPKPDVTEYIKADMLTESKFFDIIMQDDGTALVTIKYGALSGNRWLALVDSQTIPQPNQQGGQ